MTEDCFPVSDTDYLTVSSYIQLYSKKSKENSKENIVN